jgi:uncharacterized protein YycO
VTKGGDPGLTIPASGLKPGSYLCIRTPGWLGTIIRAATHSDYSHTLIVGPDGEAIEATPEGVRKIGLHRYAHPGSPWLACANALEPMTAEQGMEVWAAAEAQVGAPYDFLDLAVIGAADLGWQWNAAFKLLGTGPWRICSQLAAACGQAATPPLDWLCGKPGADQVTPADLARRPYVVPVTIT